MSYDRNQLGIIEDAEADFDLALSQDKFTDCRAIIDNLGDMGFSSEAFVLHTRLNRAQEESGKCIKSTDCTRGYHSDQCPKFNDESHA